MKNNALFFLIIILFIRCTKARNLNQNISKHTISYKNNSGEIEIINTEKENQALQIIWKSKDTVHWELPYPIYHLEIADFNNDGNDEIFVGVIKKTRYDLTLSKRLFIYKIVDFEIRPLWLGSKVGNPLLSFTTLSQNDTTYIKTKELKNNADTLIGYYIKAPFGIQWIKYQN